MYQYQCHCTSGGIAGKRWPATVQLKRSLRWTLPPVEMTVRQCSDDGDYDIKSAEMASFVENRGYPRKLVTTSQKRAKEISREGVLRNYYHAHSIHRSEKVFLVFAFHLKKQQVKKILHEKINCRILTEDPTTSHIFNTTSFCVYRRDTNLRD